MHGGAGRSIEFKSLSLSALYVPSLCIAKWSPRRKFVKIMYNCLLTRKILCYHGKGNLKILKTKKVNLC